MPTLKVWESVPTRGDKQWVPRIDHRTVSQSIPFSATAGVSASFADTTSVISVLADAGCAIRVGSVPTAIATDYPVAANVIHDFEVAPRQKISVVGLSEAAPVYGPELIVNGNGTTTVGWTNQADSALLSVGGRLRVTIDANGVQAAAGAGQDITLEIGQTYRFQVTMWASEADKGRAMAAGSGMGLQAITGSGPTTVDVTFVAVGNFQLLLQPASAGAWGGANQFAEFDNISLRKIL